MLANGLNPRYSRIDPAAMAECALDEAMRNVVASGGDPDRTCVLDNYCYLVHSAGTMRAWEQFIDHWMKTYDVLFKVPIFGAASADGVRDTDEFFMRSIDQRIASL